jgi:hypothetical protein
MAILNNQRVYSQCGGFLHSKSLELKSLVKFSGNNLQDSVDGFSPTRQRNMMHVTLW